MTTSRVVVALLCLLLAAAASAACSGGDSGDAVTPAQSPAKEDDSPQDVEVSSDVEEAASGSPTGVIRVADTGEGYQWINHELFGLIIEGAYDLEMELVPVEPEALEEVLTAGDADLHLEARTPETVEWFDAAVAEGAIVNLGTTYELDDGFEVQKGATQEFVDSYPDVVAFLVKMDTRSGSLAKAQKWASREDDPTNQEVAAYYMFTFDFEERMKSWMPFDNYRAAKIHMENLYPDFRRCTNCPEADPDAPGAQ